MTGGKLDLAALHILNGEPLDRKLREENAVLRECLEIAIAELAFERFPTAIRATRLIQQRLREHGLAAVMPTIE